MGAAKELEARRGLGPKEGEWEAQKWGRLEGSGRPAKGGRMTKTRRPRRSGRGTEASPEKALSAVFARRPGSRVAARNVCHPH